MSESVSIIDACTYGRCPVWSVFRTAWGPDTCDPLDLDAWSPANPARGQCGVSALVLKELIGGHLMRGDVHLDGVRVGDHYWNRCSDGLDVDLTREQFTAGEVVVSGWIVEPPPGPPRRCRAQYELFRSRVHEALAIAHPAVNTSPYRVLIHRSTFAANVWAARLPASTPFQGTELAHR